MDTHNNSPSPTTQGKTTILVVDDNPMNLKVISGYLEEHDLKVLVAKNGETALRVANYAQPNLILLDVMMPGMNGFETCRHLKENETTKNIPVIFVSALSEIPSKIEGFQVGGVDYITKPIQHEEMWARVNTHLQLRQLTTKLEQMVQNRTYELENTLHNLERLDKAKSDFIGIISHELRTPLSVIDGYTQLLKLHPKVEEDEELNSYADSILEGTENMFATINHILEATNIDQGNLQIIKEEMNLEELLREVTKDFQHPLQKRQLLLKLKNLTHLPNIIADAKQLKRAFHHLILNAIKFTPDGGKINIDGKYQNETNKEPYIEIVISDTGIGINPEQLGLIFEKFYQTEYAGLHSSGTTKFKAGGAGLGLSIAKGIIEAHNGRIWANSLGKNEATQPGSQFWIELPVK